MFDVGLQELVVLFVIGLLILGPERLPRVAAQLGRWVGRARRTATQLRMQFEREMAMQDMLDRQRKARRDAKVGGKNSAASAPAKSTPTAEQPAGEQEPQAPGDAAAADAAADAATDAEPASAATDERPVEHADQPR